MALQIVVDPSRGDLLLRFPAQPMLGRYQPQDERGNSTVVELLVSSHELSNASPVLSHLIQEMRQTPSATYEALDPQEHHLMPVLTLPNDDARAMTILCRIIHFNLDDIDESPDARTLEKLAIACDKYQCLRLLKHCGAVFLGRTWSRRLELRWVTVEDICRLFVFAYAADLPNEAAHITLYLLLEHTGSLLARDAEAGLLRTHPLLPEGTLGMAKVRVSLCTG